MKTFITRFVFPMVLFIAAPAFAIDSDLYSLDDFIDPRILGYEFEDDTNETPSRGNDLVLTNARFGFANNYQQREIFTDSNSAFGQFDIYYYYDAMQVGYRYHRFDTDFDDKISQESHKIFLGSYHLYGKNSPVSRYLFTYEQFDFDDKSADEIGLDIDLAMDIPLFSLNSGLSFKHRDEDGEKENRILLRYSVYDFFHPRVTFRSSFGAAEIADEWDWAITKLAISAYHPIAHTSFEVHMYYSFSFRPERTDVDSRSNNEVGVFINLPLFI